MIFKTDTSLFQSMIENLPIAVLLIDANYRHIYSNSNFIRMTGLHQSESAGLGWTQGLSPEDKKSLFLVFKTLKNANGSDQQHTSNFFLAGKKSKPLTITRGIDPQIGLFFTIYFPEKIVDSAALVHSNTVITNSENESIQTKHIPLHKGHNEELITSNRHKDKLLAILAHDMGAPIACLKGLTESLLDIDLDKHERSTLRDSLLKQLSAVSELTENILLWATNSFHNSESDKKETVGILQLIEENSVVMEQQASLKNLQFSYDIPADLKISVRKDQFCMVVRNLFNNAIKYTPPQGWIKISASSTGEFIQFKITDSGIGMSDERQNSLFSFTQIYTYGTNGEKGIGLGLLLCKEYIEANNGSISIISKQNVGTTVIAAFPNALSHAYVGADANLIWK